jgi:hypothetical protein
MPLIIFPTGVTGTNSADSPFATCEASSLIS